MRTRCLMVLSLLVAITLFAPVPRQAGAAGVPFAEKWYSQTIYLPVYSSVYFGNQKKRTRLFNVAVTVSLRNTDAATPIEIHEVRYVSSAGKTLRQYLTAPQTLGPLAAVELTVDESDEEAGVGGCFIIRWKAARPVSAPLAQSVMIGTQNSQGISFISEGRMVEGVHQ
ncbi:DUF3124 domain-containing protein [Desulfovibrio subterraneus]|uniref:DUF3124 domain-containing protein n=1 Tax=Desulfovibrio subterraneus TaxID=2718620 RepID=A0A7J0BIA8_9BACT|nr:DUF3124 domain-containing protein [Desulfovibrio subterraneus]GFM32875.1 hypothetical protein DSM101010T_12400 [Desulfovibrio subterraneus]